MMTDTLPQRIEAAEGASRELDCRIWWRMTQGEGFDTAAAVVPNFNQWLAPFYTASIDAALTLVPEEWSVRRIVWMPDIVEASMHCGFASSTGRAATPALALCAAALRAKDHPHD